ncbi:hypothetical protein CW304_20550 [Bacillus sp. UFRGS-B20]|nr:hypothetical protein CW304_20550 [Bacillus sp. UFRGS-B20]
MYPPSFLHTSSRNIKALQSPIRLLFFYREQPRYFLLSFQKVVLPSEFSCLSELLPTLTASRGSSLKKSFINLLLLFYAFSSSIFKNKNSALEQSTTTI